MRFPRILLLLTVSTNFAYIVWLFLHTIGALGKTLWAAEFGIFMLPTIILVNHWNRRHDGESSMAPRGHVDIFIPVVNEPLDLFERVLSAAKRITYHAKTIYVLDDGPRQEIQLLAEQYGAKYLARPHVRTDAKAGNLNYGLARSLAPYILVLDADQEVTDPAILSDLIGHFRTNPKLALVSTHQRFDVPKGDFNHDLLFYHHMQAGKNADNASMSCGSGVVYARAALAAIGGFQTWNIVEDLYTTYRLHRAGFDTLYVNKAYTLGTAPMDLAGIYKQRGTWATDTLRLIFKDSPLRGHGLTWRQRLHYLELGGAYIVSALAVPIIFTFPVIALLLNVRFISHEMMYVFFRVPSLIAIVYLYYVLGDNSFSTGKFWASLSPVYLTAIFLALSPKKMKYAVTSKLGIRQRRLDLIIPHLIVFAGALTGTIWYPMHHGFDYFWIANVFWICLMTFWFSPVLYRGITGTHEVRLPFVAARSTAHPTQQGGAGIPLAENIYLHGGTGNDPVYAGPSGRNLKNEANRS